MPILNVKVDTLVCLEKKGVEVSLFGCDDHYQELTQSWDKLVDNLIERTKNPDGTFDEKALKKLKKIKSELTRAAQRIDEGIESAQVEKDLD